MPNKAEQLMTDAIAAVRAQVLAELTAQQKQAKSIAPQRRLLTAAEAGGYLGRSEAAIRQMIHKKQLPVVRDGRNVRIDVFDLDARINDLKM
jgi:excisionase family DNA binding protein